MLTGVPGSAPASTWPGGQVPDTVAERVRLGVAQVGLVVEAEEPCPGGEVGGDVRCEGPSLVDLPGLGGEVAQAHGLGGADSVGLDGGVVALERVDELLVLAAGDSRRRNLRTCRL